MGACQGWRSSEQGLERGAVQGQVWGSRSQGVGVYGEESLSRQGSGCVAGVCV